MENYELLYEEYLTKKIPWTEFRIRLEDFVQHTDPGSLNLFFNFITDNLFIDTDPDMLMLTYIYLWLIPNRFNRLNLIQAGDNMYLTFIKSVLDDYADAFKTECEALVENINYSIYKRKNIYIILNHNETEAVIDLPLELRNKTLYCINCGDEFETENSIELYPYGFYLIES